MSIASREDIQKFVDEAADLLDGRVEEIILFGSYAKEDYVPGSDVDIMFLVSEKEEDDWRKVSKLAGDYFLSEDIRFSPKIVEKKVFEERRNESAGFYSEVAEEGVTL